MNELSTLPEGAGSSRLRELVMIPPPPAAAKSWGGRLVAPLRRARHSIAARINLAAAGMTLLLVMLGIVIASATMHLGARTEQSRILREAALASAELTGSIGETRYHASRYAATGEAREIEAAGDTLAGAKDKLAEARDSSANVDRQAREAMEWLQVQVEGFDQELTALQGSIGAYGPSESGNALAGAIDISGEQLARQARGVQGDLMAASARADAEFAGETRRMVMTVAGLLLGCVLLTIAGARFVSRTTAGPVREITAAMSGLARGDRGVTIPGTDRQDEIGEMAQALAVFRKAADDLAHLQRMAAEAARDELARQEAEQARHAELMRQLAQRFERTVGEVVGSVAAASEQLQTTAGAMAAAAAQSATVSADVSRVMADTTSGTTAAATAGDQFALAIGEISREVANSATRAQQARRSSQVADERMASLVSTARQAEQIVTMIDDIAEQTNVLALNASIEAARGGDAGRGFGVVAGEVKNLARQTSAATRTVVEQIQAMQGSTEESVAALRQVGEWVREMETSAIAIAQSVDQQTTAGQELARNLALAAGGADEIDRNVGQLSDMAQVIGTAAAQVLQSANELHRQAGILQRQAQAFLGSVRTA
ncbi:HAMP domain-containing protein [Altererythrobacter soli]|uniref:HAMP domain-containing protein n=1 Tax=Croceibacterium soli TaxID=1739690 RepID=A0A6I4UVS9_9SPHN|nr:methyl-accepting chemotaxis protein [Croceibacterium soli]MXP42676.1 HAMP domain-containing protein [Croceibacterium soli]